MGLSGIEHVIVLKGGMGKKQRQAAAEKLASIPDGIPRVILATGSYVGEGFDDSRLDTLFLTMPISWRGTLQQYVGRLLEFTTARRLFEFTTTWKHTFRCLRGCTRNASKDIAPSGTSWKTSPTTTRMCRRLGAAGTTRRTSGGARPL